MAFFWHLPGLQQQLVDLIMTQRLGQMFVLAGPSDLNGGIVFAQVFFKGETVELFDCGEPPGFGGGGKTGRIAVHQIILDHWACGRRKFRAARLKIGQKIFQVAAIGLLRVARRAKIRRLRFKEKRNPRQAHRISAKIINSNANCCASGVSPIARKRATASMKASSFPSNPSVINPVARSILAERKGRLAGIS